MVAFVFGSRSCRSRPLARGWLSSLCSGVAAVWSGGARGADRLGAAWARSRGLAVREWLPDWSRWGRSAGVRRSADLIAALPPGSLCVCLASVPLPGGRGPGAAAAALGPGSRFSFRRCLAAGFPVVVVWACARVSVYRPPAAPGPSLFSPSAPKTARTFLHFDLTCVILLLEVLI